MSILDEMVANKRREVVARTSARPAGLVRSAARSRRFRERDFHAALTGNMHSAPRVIAEIKRRSPSRGLLRPNLDPVSIARLYEENGAAAISVLTDHTYFGGSLADMRAVSEATTLPVLCKEFIVDRYQLYEAAEAGADAALLLASVLSEVDLRAFRECAAELGLASLVEVHNERELEKALGSGARIIGINNRDLRTFAVTLDTTRELLPLIPDGVVKVSESGIHSAQDRETMRSLGVDALLVGEGLLVAEDTARAMREISGTALLDSARAE